MINKFIKWMPTNYTKKHRRRHEKGQALVIVLSILLLASLVITATLTYVGTSLNTNTIYIKNTTSLYAAEAGIQDGIWQMINRSSGDLQTLLAPVTNNPDVNPPDNPDPSIYTDNDYNPYGWTYSLPDPINDDAVDITVLNTWVPMVDDSNPAWIASVNNLLPPDGVITPPSVSKASAIVNNTKLVIAGGVSNVPVYKFNITYTGASALNILSLGVWLPQGFAYNNGSSNIHTAGGAWLYTNERLVPCAGNLAVIWTFPAGTTFSSLLSGMGQTGATLSIQLQYTTNLSKLPDCVAWMTNNINADFPYNYTWNADVKVHDMIASAGNTQIEAYVPKSETRSLGAATSGDYVAGGASLMVIGGGYDEQTDPYSDHQGVRYVLLSDSSSTINTIPTDTGTNVVGAFLYWSGWFNYGSMPASTVGPWVNFKINNHQVDFNIAGQPERGTSGVASTNNQWRSNAPTGTGYSYSSYRDVTALVQYELKLETGKAQNPGNAVYDVGPASGGPTSGAVGTTNNAWSYAGWSIIIIYSGPTTLGHQLYLYDTFSYADNGQDIDPTRNTSGPGGVISGFIVPPQLPSEIGDPNSICAKLTCFVGDGDWCFSDDFIAINAPASYLSNPLTIPNTYKLWDGITLPAPTYWIPYGDPGLPNNASSPNNVWNGYSQQGGVGTDGVDIKTFNIKWTSGLIHAGDTSARIDIPTAVDSWNLVYIILSFRSSVTSGGSISYLIRKRTLP